MYFVHVVFICITYMYLLHVLFLCYMTPRVIAQFWGGDELFDQLGVYQVSIGKKNSGTVRLNDLVMHPGVNKQFFSIDTTR